MSSVSLKELSEQLDRADQLQAAELWPSQSPALLPVVQTLATELGGDQLLAEATLAWVRQKKTEILAATLRTVYTPEQIQAMIEKAKESQ